MEDNLSGRFQNEMFFMHSFSNQERWPRKVDTAF